MFQKLWQKIVYLFGEITYIYFSFLTHLRNVLMEPINQTLKEYGRGLGGGLLFSLPMLYTMELWSTGFLAGPARLAIYLAVGLALLVGYNHFVGLRGDHTLAGSLFESVEEMGMGFVVTALILWLIGLLKPGMSRQEMVGKIVVESLTVAIGISIGKSQLGNSGGDRGHVCRRSDRLSFYAMVFWKARGPFIICCCITNSGTFIPRRTGRLCGKATFTNLKNGKATEKELARNHHIDIGYYSGIHHHRYTGLRYAHCRGYPSRHYCLLEQSRT